MNYVWIEKLLVCFTWCVQSVSRVKRLWGHSGAGGISVSIRAQCLSWALGLFPGAAAEEQRCPLWEWGWQELLLLLVLCNGNSGTNTFQKIFKLELLLRNWTPPMYTVLLGASFTLYHWQWIFQALHCFSIMAQFSFLSGYRMSQHLGLFYVCSLLWHSLHFFFFFFPFFPFLFYDPFKLTSQCTEAV